MPATARPDDTIRSRAWPAPTKAKIAAEAAPTGAPPRLGCALQAMDGRALERGPSRSGGGPEEQPRSGRAQEARESGESTWTCLAGPRRPDADFSGRSPKKRGAWGALSLGYLLFGHAKRSNSGRPQVCPKRSCLERLDKLAAR